MRQDLEEAGEFDVGSGDFDFVITKKDPVDIAYEPKWNDLRCSDGYWKDRAHANEITNPGFFGVLTGNWGGNRGTAKLQKHMVEDLRDHTCQVFALQEVSKTVHLLCYGVVD